MSTLSTTVRIKVSPQVVRIVGKEAPRDLQLSAARGALPLAAIDLVTVFFFFCNSKDQELKNLARVTLRELPVSLLEPVTTDPGVNPQILYFIAREMIQHQRLIEAILQNPSTGDETFLYCAKHCSEQILAMIAANNQRITTVPELVNTIINNPKADKALKFRLGWVDPEAEKSVEELPPGDEQSDQIEKDVGEIEEVEEENLSKYQQALVLGVSDKIKMAFTGDKEWRTLLLRDSNKLVSSAVLSNPRITEGEVLTIAKSKASNDDMIRIILMNKDWLKLSEIKKALIRHPRTPVSKALRFMSVLNDKDLKSIAGSKDVSAIVVNNARRIIMTKEKKER